MLGALRRALVQKIAADLHDRWQEAGQAWLRVVEEGDDSLDEEARASLWSAINCAQAALRGMEGALREARTNLQGTPLKAVSDTAYALSATRQLVEDEVLPRLEKSLGYPPAVSRWRLSREE